VDDCDTVPAAGDPVFLRTGRVGWTKTDLVILTGSGEMDLELSRTYNSKWNGAGVMGHNWSFKWNRWLEDLGTSIVLHWPGADSLTYSQVSADVYRYRTATVTRETDGTYTLRGTHGGESVFDSAGKRTLIRDRYGKTIMTFSYTAGQLTGIAAGGTREVTLTYNAAGFISQITDHAGRTIQYTYDANDDLVQVRYPATTQFPSGVTIDYAYSSGFAEEPLNHNILQITDGRGNVCAQYAYDSADRCVAHTEGDRVYSWTYDEPTNTMLITDPAGHIREFIFDDDGRVVQETVFTEGYHPDEPAGYVTQREYTARGRIAKEISPSGKTVTYTYQEALSQHQTETPNLSTEAEPWAFCWITEFPLFRWNEEAKRWDAEHHPFTAPQADTADDLAKDPGRVRAQAYDLVLNGTELGSGSVRIHEAALQRKVFEVLGLEDATVQERFGFLLRSQRLVVNRKGDKKEACNNVFNTFNMSIEINQSFIFMEVTCRNQKLTSHFRNLPVD